LVDFKEIFDAKPELEKAWTEATSYRESFATPDEARLAATQLADVAAMDALFFSAKADDQVKLARLVAGINPEAFQLLASAMAQVAAEGRQSVQAQSNPALGKGEQKTAENPVQQSQHKSADVAGTREQFLQETNAAAVEHIVSAIESQVDRLLPANISKNARNRTVAEIYREVDSALQQNGELESQLRLALRSGNLDPRHRDAIASLVVNRAKQVLPGVAQRVLGEWTSTVFAAEQGRRSRQRSAESRVDIAGSRGTGERGNRATSPRDINYARMSDADILNL
jgi:hypothetical protein